VPRRLGKWREATEKQKVVDVTAEQVTAQIARVTVDLLLPAGESELKTVYTVYGNGDVHVDNSIEPKGDLPELPRFGMSLEIPGEYDRITWFGRGPHENYWDRKRGAAVGEYAGSVEELITTYVRPQENGNRSDVRWLALCSEKGDGLLVIGLPTIDFSAWPYTMDDLLKAEHTHELKRRETITLNLDYRQMGVGGDDSWSRLARPHPEYTLPARDYRYGFVMRPYAKGMGRIEDIAERAVPSDAGSR
jgi:beta-galactosidase